MERYTVNDMAAALDAAPATVRRHLRSLGVHSGSGRRHEWDGARYRRLLDLVGQRIADHAPATRNAYESEQAGGDSGMQEVQSIFGMPDMPAGIEEMQISTFKATCLAVLERVGKTGQPVLVTRFGKPVAQIVPPPSGDWLGAMAGTGRILGDLTAPALDPEEWEALGQAVLLDTHIWLWALLDPARLSRAVRALLASPAETLRLSPVSVWEAMMLAERGRIALDPDPRRWLDRALAAAPVTEVPLTFEVAMASRSIALDHKDPADRFIAASALVFGLTLVTADARLLDCPDIEALPNR